MTNMAQEHAIPQNEYHFKVDMKIVSLLLSISEKSRDYHVLVLTQNYQELSETNGERQ
jgi:hypothetical protein